MKEDMQDVAIRMAEDLSVTAKSVFEGLLGRPLRNGEEVSVMAFLPHQAPTEDIRERLSLELKQHLENIDRKSQSLSDDEAEQLVDEAIRSVRPNYQEHS